MWALEIDQTITDYVRENSRFERRRPYLSMSHIADCPVEQYRYFVYGQIPNEMTHRMAFLGYKYEEILREILTQTGVLKPISRELVADFNPLFKGHIDGETQDGDLLEIKSVSAKKFEMALRGPLRKHVLQVQCYLHFGGYRHAELIYVSREDFAHKVFHITYRQAQAELLVEKAKRVLYAIDVQEEPDCECGRCNNATNV